jgi:hypothetical protein
LSEEELKDLTEEQCLADGMTGNPDLPATIPMAKRRTGFSFRFWFRQQIDGSHPDDTSSYWFPAVATMSSTEDKKDFIVRWAKGLQRFASHMYYMRLEEWQAELERGVIAEVDPNPPLEEWQTELQRGIIAEVPPNPLAKRPTKSTKRRRFSQRPVPKKLRVQPQRGGGDAEARSPEHLPPSGPRGTGRKRQQDEPELTAQATKVQESPAIVTQEGSDSSDAKDFISETGTSPKRAKLESDAYAAKKKIGKKRVETHFNKIKNVLQPGDVVHMPVSHKHKCSAGDTIIVAVVHAKVGAKYTVLTHAGLLDKNVSRNQLQYQEAVTAEFVAIPSVTALVPPISEGDALKLINPLRVMSQFCNCKKVRVVVS